MKVNGFVRLVTCTGMVFAMQGIGVAAASTDLRETLSLVYETNPKIRAERERLRATSESTPQAWASALPQISGDAGYSVVDNDQTVSSTLFNPSGEKSFDLHRTTAGVTAEQTVFSGLQNFHAIKQAHARVRAGEAQFMAVAQQVLLDAVTAYFDVVRDTTVLEANQSNVEVLTRQLEQTRIRHEFGEVSPTDVKQAEARLAAARTQLSAARTQLAVSRAAYKEVVGMVPGALQKNPPLPGLPDSEEQAHTFARSHAPRLIAIREEEEASRRQVKIQNGAFMPSISVTASYQYGDELSSFIQEDEQFAYGVRVSVPVFQGGIKISRRREAKALNARDRARIIATERRAEADVATAWQRLVQARSRIQSAQAQVEANRSALKGVKREAQAGARTTLDILNAEQELLNSMVALASARRDEQVAAYTLLTSIGALRPPREDQVSKSGSSEGRPGWTRFTAR